MVRGQRVILRAGDGQALLKKQQNIRYNFRSYRTFITFPTLTSGEHRERLCIRSSTLSQHFKGIYGRKRQISGIKDNWRKIWKTYCWACQKRLWSCESVCRFIDVSNLRPTVPRHLWCDKKRALWFNRANLWDEVLSRDGRTPAVRTAVLCDW